MLGFQSIFEIRGTHFGQGLFYRSFTVVHAFIELMVIKVESNLKTNVYAILIILHEKCFFNIRQEVHLQ